MAGFNGSGTFVRTYNWTNDTNNSINIRADRMDTEDNGFATGLSSVIVKDGQTTTTARIPFASGISVNQGVVGTPSISVTGDASTGLYQASIGSLSVSASGVLVGTFNSNGLDNTAIGVGTPAAGNFTTLNASGNFAIATNKVTMDSATGNTAIAGTLSAGTTTLGNTSATGTLGATGNFAINTNKFNITAASGNTTIAGTLGVTGTITGSAGIVGGSISSTTNISAGGSITSTGTMAVGASAGTSIGFLLQSFSLSGTSQYGVFSNPTFSSGATTIGIGCLSAPVTAAAAFTQAQTVNFYASNPTKGAGSTITTAYGFYLEDITAGGTNWGVYSSGANTPSYNAGDLLVGTLSRRAKFTVEANGASTALLALNDTDASASNRTEAIFTRAGSTVGSITATNVASSYNTSSDYRIKTDLQPLSKTATSTLMGIPVYSLVYTQRPEERIIGALAHEIQAKMPEAVTGEKDAVDADGNPILQMVDYSKLVLALLAMNQEQQRIIEDFAVRIAALEAKP